MSAVLDASVLVAALSDFGAEGAWAEKIVGEGGHFAPHFALVEATNILRRLELTKKLGRQEATAAARDLLKIDLELAPFEPFAERIWELRNNVTSYDAWYIAIAEDFDLPLATLDRPLAASTGPRCRFLLPPAG